MPSSPLPALVPARGDRPRRRLPPFVWALLATLLVATTLLPPPAGAAPEDPDTPFLLTLDALDALTLDGDGPVRLEGTLTNVTEESYERVDVYPVLGDSPITTESELAQQTELPASAYVGDRVLREEGFDTVEDIGPGESATWSITIARSDLAGTEQPGVYWVGAHALIPDGAPVSVADGRVRTFLPRVPAPEPTTAAGSAGGDQPGGQQDPPANRRPAAAPATAEQVSLVLPLRRRILRTDDGRVRHLEHWTQALSPRGRLGRLLEVGQSASRLTWLLDPAVLDAVEQLAAGNPPRDLGPTEPAGTEEQEDGDGGEDASPGEDASEPSPSGSDSPSASASPEELDPTTRAAQEAAAGWLAELPAAIAGHEVLALPYADPDIAALAAHAPDLYPVARERGARVLSRLGITAEPAVAPPTGFLDQAGLALLEDDPVVLLSDDALPNTAGPQARVAGRTVVTTSSLAGAGGPGPTDPHAPVELRQQTASVAALRHLADQDGAAGRDAEPVVVLLPDDWQPPADSATYVAPFDGEDWVELTTVSDAVAGWPATGDSTDRLVYPDADAEAQVDAERFAEAELLLESGRSLQRLLSANDHVASEVTDEALTSLSYSARIGGTKALVGAREEISGLLRGVHVEGPTGVNLSSSSGEFAVSVVNHLPEPVTVRLLARSASGIEVRVPEGDIQVPGEGRSSLRLSATTSSTGVHQTFIQLTDTAGGPVGQGDSVPIRTAQVSGIIWGFIGVGCGLLFLAIAVRLVRRLRGRSRDASAEAGEDA